MELHEKTIESRKVYEGKVIRVRLTESFFRRERERARSWNMAELLLLFPLTMIMGYILFGIPQTTGKTFAGDPGWKAGARRRS